MGKPRSWTDQQLIEAVKVSRSYRNVLLPLRLIPAGGNYEHVKARVKVLGLDTAHFTGMGWNVGLIFRPNAPAPIETLLVKDSTYQSFL
jgi:hypothetical protein